MDIKIRSKPFFEEDSRLSLAMKEPHEQPAGMAVSGGFQCQSSSLTLENDDPGMVSPKTLKSADSFATGSPPNMGFSRLKMVDPAQEQKDNITTSSIEVPCPDPLFPESRTSENAEVEGDIGNMPKISLSVTSDRHSSRSSDVSTTLTERDINDYELVDHIDHVAEWMPCSRDGKIIYVDPHNHKRATSVLFAPITCNEQGKTQLPPSEVTLPPRSNSVVKITPSMLSPDFEEDPTGQDPSQHNINASNSLAKPPDLVADDWQVTVQEDAEKFPYRKTEFWCDKTQARDKIGGEFVLPACSGVWRDVAPLSPPPDLSLEDSVQMLLEVCAEPIKAMHYEEAATAIGSAFRAVSLASGIPFGASPALGLRPLSLYYRLVTNNLLMLNFVPEGGEVEQIVENCLCFVEAFRRQYGDVDIKRDYPDSATYKIAYLEFGNNWVDVVWDQNGSPVAAASADFPCALESCDIRMIAPAVLSNNFKLFLAELPTDSMETAINRCMAAVLHLMAFDIRPFMNDKKTVRGLLLAKNRFYRALLPTQPIRSELIAALSNAIQALRPLLETSVTLDPGLEWGSSTVLDSRGQLRGGTKRALIEEITRHDRNNSQATAALLLTYPAFMSPLELMELLRDRFSVQPTPGISREAYGCWEFKIQMPIRIRVVNVLKQWLEYHWAKTEEDALDTLWPALKGFVDLLLEVDFPGASVLENMAAIRKGEEGRAVRRTSSTASIVPSEKIAAHAKGHLEWQHVPSLEIARQLTLRKFAFYSKITPRECIWRNLVPAEGVAVTTFVDNWNKETCWVSQFILSGETAKERKATIEYFIEIAKHCRSLNNFSSMMSIIAALYSAGVHRLKKTWSEVSKDAMEDLEVMCQLMNSSRNFSEYRSMLSLVSEPAVPFLGTTLMDLRFTIDGNPENLNNDPSLINFGKWITCARIIDSALRFQKMTYPLSIIPEVQQLLDREIAAAKPLEEHYVLSLEREPRRRRNQSADASAHAT